MLRGMHRSAGLWWATNQTRTNTGTAETKHQHRITNKGAEQNHPGVAIFDGTHTCVFNKGFRDKHEKQKKDPWPLIPVDPIPSLRMLADGSSYTCGGMRVGELEDRYDERCETERRQWFTAHYNNDPENTAFWQQDANDQAWYVQAGDQAQRGVFHPTCLAWIAGPTPVSELKVTQGIDDYVSMLKTEPCGVYGPRRGEPGPSEPLEPLGEEGAAAVDSCADDSTLTI